MMTNHMRDSLAFDDEDRLPWLEPAYDGEGEDEVSVLRVALLVLAGLVLIGVVVAGVYLARGHFSSANEAQLIPAPQGAYKIPASDADAKKFQGEGDASFPASEGIERSGTIDPSRLPEAPIVGGLAEKVPVATDRTVAAPASKKLEAAVADRTGSKAQKPATWSAPAGAGGTIQLGAYGTDALARDAWGRLSKRFDYLASLTYNIQPVTVGGAKFYRLRAVAGKDAATLCGKLKVAGENCIVVN